MIVGAYWADDKDEMARLQEYPSSFNHDRFAEHERFFVEDVRRWLRSRFDVAPTANRTAVCGVSSESRLSLRKAPDPPTDQEA